MIYRAHRKSNPDGSFGQCIGYLTLCQAFISNQLIYDRLRENKLIPSAWLPIGELIFSPSGTHMYGVYAYTVSIAPTMWKPRAKTLMYLYPVENKKEREAQQKTTYANQLYSSIPFVNISMPTGNYTFANPYSYYNQPIQEAAPNADPIIFNDEPNEDND